MCRSIAGLAQSRPAVQHPTSANILRGRAKNKVVGCREREEAQRCYNLSVR